MLVRGLNCKSQPNILIGFQNIHINLQWNLDENIYEAREVMAQLLQTPDPSNLALKFPSILIEKKFNLTPIPSYDETVKAHWRII